MKKGDLILKGKYSVLEVIINSDLQEFLKINSMSKRLCDCAIFT